MLTKSSKLIAQLEQNAGASSALLPDLTRALDDLSGSVSNAVDLAVKVSLEPRHSVPC